MITSIDTHLPSSMTFTVSGLGVILPAVSLIATATPLAGSPSSPGAAYHDHPRKVAVLCARRCAPSSAVEVVRRDGDGSFTWVAKGGVECEYGVRRGATLEHALRPPLGRGCNGCGADSRELLVRVEAAPNGALVLDPRSRVVVREVATYAAFVPEA
eukprot:scaffold112117_cov31-Tisochrysis_lutea.AAC.2